MKKLAIHGGAAVGTVEWPEWPPSTARLENELIDTVRSGRWTISGPYRGVPSKEAEFAAAFARYCNTGHGVAVCNGSHALVTALEGLGIGPGDEVIIPGYTWVADASAVLNINATPILVDVDETLCLDPAAVEAAITSRTAAIIAVHLFNSMPKWNDLIAVAERHDLPLIEDAAQAHGAAWEGKRAGSLSIVSAFSFQQSKLFTAGEGGIALTSDNDLAARMKRIRCDGRDYIANPVLNELDIDETSVTPLMGSNYCMSDVSASLLLSRLPDLDDEISRRVTNMSLLDDLIDKIEGVSAVRPIPGVTTRPTYKYAFRVDRSAFGGASLDSIISAFRSEIGIYAERTDPPLNKSNLYRPHTKRRYYWPGRPEGEIDPGRFSLPNAELEHERVVLLNHAAMLTDGQHMERIAEALHKVQQHAGELVA